MRATRIHTESAFVRFASLKYCIEKAGVQPLIRIYYVHIGNVVLVSLHTYTRMYIIFFFIFVIIICVCCRIASSSHMRAITHMVHMNIIFSRDIIVGLKHILFIISYTLRNAIVNMRH